MGYPAKSELRQLSVKELLAISELLLEREAGQFKWRVTYNGIVKNTQMQIKMMKI